MLSPVQAERLIQSLPKPITHEDHRTACSVIIGVRDGKSLSQIVSYYSLSNELANKWWNKFNFSEVRPVEKKKRGAKTSKLDAFIKENIGKTLKSNEIIERCEITTPTLYNYINANRGYFKKVARGSYLIVDPQEERKLEKNDR
jgi:transposase